ncbi:MAG: small ribosomal subunit Rsm22 family protein [Candidatus Latescibacterota bacterium]
MSLPPDLALAIAEQTACCPPRTVVRAAAELSLAYRNRPGARTGLIASQAHRLAYLATRLPATFAALRAVFVETRRRLPNARIGSLLDLGAGPGTAGWAAAAVFGELERITLVERDEEWIRMGTALARGSGNAALAGAAWAPLDMQTPGAWEAHDLVVASYALGEVDPAAVEGVVQGAWSAAGTALAVVEPGTMAGFGLIRRLRRLLTGLGGSLVAPCPHQAECPLPEGDWCHFAERLGRSSLHRRLKGGELGHEDEKYSYVVASPQAAPGGGARIIRHPRHRGAHVGLVLCQEEGLRILTVPRSDRARWKQARQAAWGDQWPSSGAAAGAVAAPPTRHVASGSD